MRFLKNVGFWLGLPIILVAVWWAATLGDVNPFVPKPGDLVVKLFQVWFGSDFLANVVPSLSRLLVGLAVSIVLGITLGILIGSWRWVRWLLEPALEFLRAVPPTVLIPVLLLVIGINDGMKITIIVLGCLWPILLNTISGVRSIDSVLADSARVYGIGGWARLRHLVLPGAAPQIMTGVRQSLSVGLILMIVSEMFATTDGIGFAIIGFQNSVSMPEMWSGILLLGLIGIALSVIFSQVQKRVLRWYEGLKEASNEG
ncbi:ABC transporter permease [Lysinimonas soli]|uniref:ABC transporter permease n=1 Tax=Lysinimonas soli TaxID=1074233 RepID=A0ABW0NR19_9MICO